MPAFGVDEIPSAQPLNSEPMTIISSPEKYLIITHYLIPQKEFYSIDDKIRIGIEIRDMRFKNPEDPLENVTVHEIIDRGLNITSNSKYCYRIHEIPQLRKYYNELYVETSNYSTEDKFLILWNNSTNMANTSPVSRIDLRGHERLVYWYNITPKKFGEFTIKTIVRSDQYSDIESHHTILVPAKGKPKLTVDSVIDKNEIGQYDSVGIKYYITCRDDSNIFKDWNISAGLAESENGYIIKKSPPEKYVNGTISKDQTMTLNWTIAYPYVGKYKIPEIKINGVVYPQDATINVVSFYNMYNNFLNLLILILSFLSGAFALYLHSKGKDLSTGLKEFYNEHTSISILICLIIFSISAYSFVCLLDPNAPRIDILILKNKSSFKWLFYMVIMFMSIAGLIDINRKLIDSKTNDQIRKVISEANHKLSEGFAKSDASIAASVFYDDSSIHPPDMPMIQGKKEIEKFLKSTMESGVREIQIETSKISIDRDFAVERGVKILEICSCGCAVKQNINYVIIWMRFGHNWKIMSYIWNKSP